MKILDVSPRNVFPPRQGSSVRTFHLLRHLSRTHEVRQFSLQRRFSWRAAEDEIEISPSYRERRSFGGIGGLLVELSERSWVSAPILAGAALAASRPSVLDSWLDWADVVLVEFPWQFSFCARRRPRGGLVLSGHNVEPEKFVSYADTYPCAHFRKTWLSLIERAERNAVRRADLVIAVSAPDREVSIVRYGADPERVVEIPNGADTETCRPCSPVEKAEAKRILALPDRPVVLFAGADVPPNRAALKWVERLAGSSGEFTFLVVGRVAKPRRKGSLVALGMIEDFALCLRAADISICPVSHGGGTKIKLLEALAAGLPTVVFEESLQGLALRDGEHVIVSEKSEGALLESLRRLARDPELACRLGGNGSRLVGERYSWEESARKLEANLVRIGGSRRHRSRPAGAAR